MAKEDDVMLDLETLSSKPNAAIAAIGAVFFSSEGLGREFYSIIDPESAEKFGHISGSTFAWWCQQSAEARKIFLPKMGIRLGESLLEFQTWVNQAGKQGKVGVWGNGSDFDCVILRHAYEQVGLDAPWRYNYNRCYRTVKAEFDRKNPGAGKVLWDKHSVGLTHHNALDDAKRQALMLIEMRS